MHEGPTEIRSSVRAAEHPAGGRIRWRAFERNARLSAVRDRLLGNLSEPFSLDTAAAIAGVSSKHFSSWFRARAGVRFVVWVHEMRLRAAEPLVAGTDRPLTDVARTVGFGSLRSFERAFVRRFGTNPRRHRNRLRP